ncbi:hypothetical protein [Paractinoplanes lichenicola]|uniref:Uncharacterized protein n=1 Tax=Paractinoplanes lichenicola TaxID=2802976 RepID=A0ABS1VDI0_9ACTN|nr:hypothetical protein [Actinoplanes lichenicola]MBL7252688.1 hypothetical protein [Actinoplanes lichenicola]
MMIHPDLMLTLANEHHRELIAERDRERLLTSARAARKARRAAKNLAARGRPTGSLSAYDPSVAAPAR